MAINMNLCYVEVLPAGHPGLECDVPLPEHAAAFHDSARRACPSGPNLQDHCNRDIPTWPSRSGRILPFDACVECV